MAHKLKEENINVFVRFRPNTEQEKESKCDSLLNITSPKRMVLKHDFAKKYRFHHIFDETSTQREIYSTIVRPLIPEVIKGYNCTVFAYGQTGSGKTYTMTGGEGESQGIIPRAFEHIFDVLDGLNTNCSVRVSYIQLYNEELIDMLSTNERPIRMFDDKNQKGSVVLHGIEEISVTNKNEVYNLLEMGNYKRKTASTLMNGNSSRSHTVFTIIIHSRETTVSGEELVRTGKLNLVDLAGSENIPRSGSMDLQAREAGSINQSLLILGRVIKVLTEKKSHIPYQQSKLTRLLRGSLGGATKTSFIATLSNASVNYEETTGTLDFAMKAKCVKNRPEVNQKISRAALVQQYVDEVDRLKKDLQVARSGNSVYLDEDNYKRLLEKNDRDRNDLIGKMTTIRNLQITLDQKNHLLQMAKDSWIAAVDNIKMLKLKHGTELKECETKTTSLENKFYENSETFHNNLSRLYQTSENNKEVINAFIDTYSQINNEITHYIDNSIMVAQNCTDQFGKFEVAALENNFAGLRICLQNMTKLYADIQNFKTNYLKTLSTRTQMAEHFDKFQLEVKANRDRFRGDVYNVIHDMLPQLKSAIENASLVLKDKTKAVFDVLSRVRSISAQNLHTISFEFLAFHSTVMVRYEQIFKRIELQNRRLMSNKKFVAQMRENINEMLYHIEENEDEAILQNNEISVAIDEIRKAIDAKTTYLSGNIRKKVEAIETDCMKAIQGIYVNKLIKNETCIDNCVKLMGDRCKATVSERLKDIETCFDKVDKNIAEMGDKYLEQMGTCEEYFDHLTGISDNINLNIENAINIVNKCSNNNRDLRAFLDKIKQGVSQNNEILGHIRGKQKVMLDTVQNICSDKLNYPTQTGKTPQRVPQECFSSEKENIDPNIPSGSNSSVKSLLPVEGKSTKRSRQKKKGKKLWRKTH